MRYRPEIDGLRAVAVVPVILFHAGFNFFAGGFVGVDVFFVISGYLITTILIEDMDNDCFSLVDFYERRARRILPALFLVMLLCIPCAVVWMPPPQMADFSRSLVAVCLFVSNVLFWRESGYFAEIAEEKPLLHTWSLAVEEQYYSLFPIFLSLIWRFGRNRVFWTICIIAALSLLLSEWGWRTRATANFYLTPTRVWELLAGSIAAFIIRNHGVHGNEVLSRVGLAAILGAIFVYDETIPFPSVYALLPVIGVVLLILFTDRDTLVGKLLGCRGFVGIGVISYSAYLWHQPLLAFARLRFLDAPPPALMGMLSLVSLLMAYLSWKYVETPFRARKGERAVGRGAIFALSAAGLMLFSVLGVLGHLQQGFTERFDIAPSVYASIGRSERRAECLEKEGIHHRADWTCRLGDRSAPPRVLVFGDSHALSFLPAMDTALSERNEGGYFVATSGCTPFLGIHALREGQRQTNCYALNSRVMDFVRDQGIGTVFLVARWTYYTDGGYDGTDFSYIGLQENAPRDRETSRHAFEYGLTQTIRAYTDMGVMPVIVAQVPQQKYRPLDIYLESARSGRALDAVSVSREEHERLQAYVRGLFALEDGVQVLDFTDVFCGLATCSVGSLGVSWYFDEDHLALSGSALMLASLRDFLSSLE